MKRAEGSFLKEEEEVTIDGRLPVGRPEKKWRAYLAEGMNNLRIEEHMAQDCQLQVMITHPTPTVNGKLGTLNDDDNDVYCKFSI